jgi:hypothetical protein
MSKHQNKDQAEVKQVADDPVLDEVTEGFLRRDVEAHKIKNDGTEVNVFASDAPGLGGGNSFYVVTKGEPESVIAQIQFASSKNDGLTNEALIAIVQDRLLAFEKGPFKCEENVRALAGLDTALHWLRQRTVARIHRGVEGREHV